MVENVDGVIMTGGVDIHPFRFNEEPNPKIGEISKERDDFDFLIMKHAFENNKPIFGICRGIQLINVFFGGTLIQDINSQTNTKILHSQTAPRDKSFGYFYDLQDTASTPFRLPRSMKYSDVFPIHLLCHFPTGCWRNFFILVQQNSYKTPFFEIL